jgi:5'-nucleotidase
VVALVDMDGTLADYTGELNRRLGLMRSPHEPELPQSGFAWDGEPEYIKERMQVIKGNPGFWTKLPPLTDGFEVLDAIQSIGYSIHILTKGPRYAPIGWMEKLTWCEQHIKHPHDITITMDKGLVYGRVLVDDYPEYALRWLKWRKRGTVIMPDRPWNQGFKHPQVYRYTGDVVEMRSVAESIYLDASAKQRVVEPS